MDSLNAADRALGRNLVLDELFDLTFYQELRRTSRGPLRDVLDRLIPVETRHCAFWREFFSLPELRLDLTRRVKLRVLLAVCRLIGAPAVQLALEAIEIYGIRKYLALWQRHRDGPLGVAMRDVLKDEFEHEDAIVAASGRPFVRPDDVRSIFLGLNDGLVEILGAVSGFFAAFQQPHLVLMAGSSVAVAGAISMGAGLYAAESSEREVSRLEAGKAEFLGAPAPRKALDGGGPLRAAGLVGFSYLLGALVPLGPVVLGARTLIAPLVAAGGVLIVVSAILAFLSGMEARKRAAMNLSLMVMAVAVTYGIGALARSLWGLNV